MVEPGASQVVVRRSLLAYVVSVAALAAASERAAAQVSPGAGGTVARRALAPQAGMIRSGVGLVVPGAGQRYRPGLGYGGAYGPAYGEGYGAGYGGAYGPGYGGGYGPGYGGGYGPGYGGFGYGPGYGGYVGESYYERRVVEVLTRAITAGGQAGDCPIYELSGTSAIARVLRSRKLDFKRNASVKVEDRQATVDFLIGKDTVIEYWSADVDEKKAGDKRAFLDGFRNAGGKVYIIGPKDTKDTTTIQQDLERVLDEAGLTNQAKNAPTTQPASTQREQAPAEPVARATDREGFAVQRTGRGPAAR